MKRIAIILCILCLTLCGCNGKVRDEAGLQDRIDAYQKIATDKSIARTLYYHTTDQDFADTLPDGSAPSYESYVDLSVTYAPLSGWVSYTIDQDRPGCLPTVVDSLNYKLPAIPNFDWNTYRVTQVENESIWECYGEDGSMLVVSEIDNALTVNYSKEGDMTIWTITKLLTEPPRPTLTK